MNVAITVPGPAAPASIISRPKQSPMRSYHLDHLHFLETQPIRLMREVAAEFERPSLMFFGGPAGIR